jgi:hypothetical protein
MYDVRMKLQWFWNRNFEDLMKTLGEWLGKQESITVVHTDIKFEGDKIYFVMIYRQ